MSLRAVILMCWQFELQARAELFPTLGTTGMPLTVEADPMWQALSLTSQTLCRSWLASDGGGSVKYTCLTHRYRRQASSYS
ncbi:hypothetical protein [Pseudomonas sp. R76]|uniref:hypothetical protein n=1 Tax=Pseudomonas sp. R76 TaxID=1573711 RepID=UPI001358B956|nr:hypothetical protein [Pseudomonas sp. R76]